MVYISNTWGGGDLVHRTLQQMLRNVVDVRDEYNTAVEETAVRTRRSAHRRVALCQLPGDLCTVWEAPGWTEHIPETCYFYTYFTIWSTLNAKSIQHPCHDGNIELGLAFAGDHAVRNQRTTQPCSVRLN